jgi:AcrR family transcriptional regulator
MAGLRERKKLETRAALREAAILLSLEHGPAAVTVNDICAATDVSPRTFFNYFETKEEALFGWDKQTAEELFTRLAGRPAEEPPLAALRQAMLDTIPSIAAETNWPERRQLLNRHPELHAKFSPALRRSEEGLVECLAERLGLPANDLGPLLLAGAAMSGLRASFVAWSPQQGPEGMRRLIESAFDTLAAGLPAPHREL